jgi:hypothetical protein
MTNTTAIESRIENYLAQVRTALHGLPDSEKEDTLRELRSHVVELSGTEGLKIDAALQTLGDPVALARTYRAENQMVQAECSGSPLVILQGLRHASRTGWGRLTLTSLYAFGYIEVVTFWLAAFQKLYAPSRTGLWYTPGNIWSFKWVTDGSAPAGAHELLGWWFVPIAVAAGWVLRIVVDRLAQAWIARYRRLNASQEA